jgi:hypothetical protein
LMFKMFKSECRGHIAVTAVHLIGLMQGKAISSYYGRMQIKPFL